MFTSETTPPAPELSAAGDNQPGPLFFNTLSFSYPAKTVQISFSTDPAHGTYRLLPSQVPASLIRELPPDLIPPHFYVRFHNEMNDATVPVELAAHPDIARAWCIHRMTEILAPQADYWRHRHPWKPEFWYRAAEGSFPVATGREQADEAVPEHVFHRFTIQVLHEPDAGQPELLIGYNGAAHILQQSLDAFEAMGTDTRLFGLVAWRRRIFHWNRLSPAATYHPHEVFPVLNPDLADELGTAFTPHYGHDRYDASFRLISDFMQKFCMDEKFLEVVPHNGRFRAVAPGDTGVLPGACRKLQFGQGCRHTDPLEGIRKYGPLLRPRGSHFRCFFIYFSQNEGEADLLHRYITGREGTVRLSRITCMQLSYAPEHNIVIHPGDDPEEQVEKRLQQLSFDPQVIYFAFYITPWPKKDQDTGQKRLYYRIKELLMNRQLSVQALEAGKLNGDFSLAFCTIGCALVAKLGGLPWRPEGDWQKDPVVGFSTLHDRGTVTAQHGAAVYFLPGGSFGGATLYPAGDSRPVWGLALAAYRECMENHPGMQRLVIHSGRQFTDDEMELLEKMLGELQLDIPVVVAAISQCRSSDLLVFGNPQVSAAPADGTWTRCGTNSYLLNCGNRRRQSGHKSPGTEQVLPLHIDLRCTRPAHLEEAGVVTGLLDQVYGFTRMHWHSAHASPLPVTLAWPDRLAGFVPWFRNKMLPVHGRCVPWFL